MNREEFIKAVCDLGIEVTEEKLDMLEKYYKLLVEWNEKINLTAITEHDEVYLKHFYDSLTLCKVISLDKEESLCDIGTGAGFPGIVLKIFFPNLKLTLVDALNKRIKFLDIVCQNLGLEDVTLVHARAEEYSVNHRELFDIVTARAVAPMNILLEYSIPLVKNGKYFIAMKANENLKDSYNALNLLKCEVKDENKFLLPKEDSNRTIIKVQKLEKTSKKYPRRYAEMKKKPL